MEQNDNGLPDSHKGFEEALQLLEAFKEMTQVMMELIRKPAVNKTYNYHVYHGPVYNYNSMTPKTGSHKEEKRSSQVPTFKEMITVFKKACKEGLWNSMRSWGVGFQMWKIWGWDGTVSDFVDLVNESVETAEFEYGCNLDAVYKMISKGHLSLHLENWRKDGVLEAYCLLGELINNELMMLYPPKPDELKE